MLYLIRGDETLLLEEAIENILNTQQNMGKKVFNITDSNTLDAALLALKSPDLFNPMPIYIFTMTDKIYKTLQKKLKLLPPDTKTITIYPVTLKQFPTWLEKQFQQASFTLDIRSKDLLCTYLEGNMLAAKQCIEKLKLFYPKGQDSALTEEQLLEVLTPSARYSIFDFLHYLAENKFNKISIILKNLFESGIEPALLLWGLARECRRRQNTETLPILIEADEIIKGIRPGNAFEALERAAFALQGKTFP